MPKILQIYKEYSETMFYNNKILFHFDKTV